MAVSYQQFLDAWNKSKWKDEWSQSDRDLAQLHPEFGMSMLSLKDDWHNATTPEQRAIANEGAEYQRKTWGNYTGGTDGSGYYSLGPLHEEADKKQQEITGYGPFDYSRAPDYQGVMDRVLNYGPFDYDYKTDPSYQAYAKQYAREGRRASEDTMGQYAAMTGGRPSTAAMTAAQQAGNYYSAQMADKIPELYQQAYNRYLQEYQRQLQALDALDTDRRFEYGAYGDRYNQLLSQYDTVRGQENAEREQQNAEEATKYQRKISEDETNYAREQDRLNRERQDMLDSWSAQDQAWQDAQRRAQHGDYSGLDAMGVDTTEMRKPQYAYADDGSIYDIGSYKAQFFIASAAPGQTMQGDDGSIWRKNEDGTVTISKGGKTYTIGQAKAAEAPVTPRTPVTPPDDGGDGTPFPDVPKDAGIANRNDENGVYVRGKYYSWDDVWPLIQQGVLRYTYNQKNNRVTIDVPKEGEN